ncbi:MAG: FAD-dependent oxidoreductase [Candidatus Bipolaricaulota bacterium]|nr:FAD-dependent oxidoreductase [Candidatus Bipolaricaulota bacterium]MDW8126804.1 FAD-dependent oxidoreductase [Candidatus Bipolaricaulota bacterium]
MRLETHPILEVKRPEPFTFFFQGQELLAYPGETIASALFAHGIRVFGRHHKDGAPQGIFCANGQCAQCLVLADGRPVKACMTLVRPGMQIAPLDGLPQPPPSPAQLVLGEIEEIEVEVLVIGGGPAGMSAAVELGKLGIKTLLVDDKHRLGGKLLLQTHRFFGSQEAVFAGTRGIVIAEKLASEVRAQKSVEVWLNSPALAVFSDKKVGVLKEGRRYVLVRPKILLVATGARERSLLFPGNTLPGVYGAGAFQTLVNRDLVRAGHRLFVVGGGNVGLIAAYHALQAGIEVVGLCEALPECTGYKVHKDKLLRLGVPIYTSHTVLAAHGHDHVEGITIVQVDEKFQPLPGTEKTFACDTILIAVGLDPVDEFYRKAREFGIPAFACGDAQEIAEASAAIFTGRIAGRKAAQVLGYRVEVPAEWERTAEILKSKPGKVHALPTPPALPVFPVIHCAQEIPCDPCASVCPLGLIQVDPTDIRKPPRFSGARQCSGCGRCVAFCPGLAISLVDFRRDPANPTVSVPWEFGPDKLQPGEKVLGVDWEGKALGEAEVQGMAQVPGADHTWLVRLKVPRDWAVQVAGIRLRVREKAGVPVASLPIPEEAVVCRCERVRASEIRALIRQGVRDLNEIKAVTRAGMGACGGKTCRNLILRLLREEGVPPEEITDFVTRPLFLEVPLGIFAGMEEP